MGTSSKYTHKSTNNHIELATYKDIFQNSVVLLPQVALSKAGYHCGDDEMRWWQFGSSTVDALKTFQVR
jgi:hypothetical protein